ncbi:hypothetical protein OGAPHI_000964 [Ogataea philodendri]|uniref:Uncharacterized protein n=1 Tax=Ogataea philodendri TaxID=1378263 RepID=A0A9P8PFD5_9ASCO|nr:uncharacterized protein OGAPHI_000964 [Ogataea philodendri]KAH3670449.1 hypothetical protein OGAPHI_000964 [Ogataea philodendri]
MQHASKSVGRSFRGRIGSDNVAHPFKRGLLLLVLFQVLHERAPRDQNLSHVGAHAGGVVQTNTANGDRRVVQNGLLDVGAQQQWDKNVHKVHQVLLEHLSRQTHADLSQSPHGVVASSGRVKRSVGDLVTNANHHLVEIRRHNWVQQENRKVTQKSVRTLTNIVCWVVKAQNHQLHQRNIVRVKLLDQLRAVCVESLH